MKPYYQDNHRTVYNKDCRDMSEIPSNTIQCVVTSPPYWGLRKYAGEQDLIWGGDNHHEHEWVEYLRPPGGGHPSASAQVGSTKLDVQRVFDGKGAWCSTCGAWRGQYGLEPTPEMYVQHTIEILREIRRVLRKDGVVFFNIGDSYWGGKGQSGQPMSAEDQQERHGRGESINQAQHQLGMPTRPQDGKHPTLKPKDLCLIPFRVAISAQEDGWWLRSVIIWSKPNPMPESVTDRPTNSHEYLLMLTKSSKYYWDQEAVREPYSPTERWGGDKYLGAVKKGTHGEDGGLDRERSCFPDSGRNLRSVWEFPTQPYPEAHFAVFPEKLPELCIKAATPEQGCCSQCGAPWERITDVSYQEAGKGNANLKRKGGVRDELSNPYYETRMLKQVETLGWKPGCKCQAEAVPSIVLDPFAGSGTTLKVAAELNRKSIGYEISEEYCKLIEKRNLQQVIC